MDFHYLDKVCPKDDFPLPNIDILVDNTSLYQMLSLMDGFSSYNQICVNPDNQHKMNFTIPWGTYYYRAMTCGLENANATY